MQIITFLRPIWNLVLIHKKSSTSFQFFYISFTQILAISRARVCLYRTLWICYLFTTATVWNCSITTTRWKLICFLLRWTTQSAFRPTMPSSLRTRDLLHAHKLHKQRASDIRQYIWNNCNSSHTSSNNPIDARRTCAIEAAGCLLFPNFGTSFKSRSTWKCNFTHQNIHLQPPSPPRSN